MQTRDANTKNSAAGSHWATFGRWKNRADRTSPVRAPPPGTCESTGVLGSDVYTSVKAGVIPVRVMITAPASIGIHAVDVLVDLRAVVSMLGSVSINPCAISFQFSVAILSRVA
jgi:hypothetical protein